MIRRIFLLLSLTAFIACRSHVKKTSPASVNSTGAATGPAQTVRPADRDIVPEARQTDDIANVDASELNRLAAERRWVQDVFFNYASSQLSSDAQEALASSAKWLNGHRDISVLLEGHCDERGTEQYNLALGDRRAHTVRDYLVSLGIDSTRISTISYGEERPFDEGHGESAWSQNRRAHFVLRRR